MNLQPAPASDTGLTASQARRLLEGKTVSKTFSSAPAYAKNRIPIVNEPEVRSMVKYLVNERRGFLEQAIPRRERYYPGIKRIFTEYRLPMRLINLALIESGYDKDAVSRSGAVGVWQFMPTTAQAYGLDVTWLTDDRRNVTKSTVAAAKYLTRLYRMFDDWYLAIAAYNGGPGTIRRAMKKSGKSDFFSLARGGYLRKETAEYVPKFLAACAILKNPRRYGF